MNRSKQRIMGFIRHLISDSKQRGERTVFSKHLLLGHQEGSFLTAGDGKSSCKQVKLSGKVFADALGYPEVGAKQCPKARAPPSSPSDILRVFSLG